MVLIHLSVDLLLIVIAVLILLLVGFSIYLTFKRSGEVLERMRKEKYIRNKQDGWYEYFQDGTFTFTLLPKNKMEIEGLEQLFRSYLKNVSNPDIKEKIRQFCNQYMKRHYRTLLKSKRWSIRMNTLNRIAEYRIDSLLNDCRRLERKKLSQDEYFQLRKIYSLFDAELFMEKLANSPAVFSEYEYKKLLAGTKDELLRKLLGRAEELPLPCRTALIDILGMKRSGEYLPLLESMLRHEHPEIRIRTLKAIHEIGIIVQLDPYVPFVSSPIWEERLMVAKLLGNIPLSQSYSYLKTLLEDSSWWVRSQAAKTIGNDKQGRELLKQYTEMSNDRYAIDMANEVLKITPQSGA